MTSNPSQFLTSVQPVLETSGPRNCRICKRKDAIPPGDSRSSCERCRDQRRKYRLKRIKERQIAAQKVSTGNVDKSGVEGAQSLSAGSQLAKKGRKTTSQKMGPPPLKKKVILYYTPCSRCRNASFYFYFYFYFYFFSEYRESQAKRH
ncbi:hypothetical protein AX15_006645 [Amanita polypyramis BW_CC]|nr:hypothetical protein AX15_006645 [Amanita polypyramis BW_CC]